MIETLVGQALFMTALSVAGLVLARLIPVDKTLCCMAGGLVAGFIVGPVGIDTGIRAGNVQTLVFYVLLPPLLFQAAWHTPPSLLRRWAIPIILFATLGVALSVVTVAIMLFAGINHAGFPWIAALLGGALLSATDPVSVVNMLRDEKAPEDVATLVEGESLLNDAAAAILFVLFLSMATSGDSIDKPWNLMGDFAIHIVGGIAAGLVFGSATSILVLFLKSKVLTHVIPVLSAFGSFYVAQHLLDLSGIITVVVTGLTARSGLRCFDGKMLQQVNVTWQWLGDTFLALIFTLTGLVIVPGMFFDQWLAIIIAIVAALVARTVAVYSCVPLASLLMQRQSIPRNWKPLLVWGGLRGAIAIALVLTLPTQLSYWYTLQSMVFGVVLFNLLVQGTSCRPLIQRLDEPA